MKLVKQQTEDWRAKQWKKKYGYKGKKEKKNEFSSGSVKKNYRKRRKKCRKSQYKKGNISFFNFVLSFFMAAAFAKFTFTGFENEKKSWKMPLYGFTFGLIWTIYFCLRCGWAETEVGVWRQIASIYSSKLKVLSGAVRAFFHFPLH